MFKTLSGTKLQALDYSGKIEGDGRPTGKAEEAPSRTAESLERKGTDKIYNRKQQSMRKQP